MHMHIATLLAMATIGGGTRQYQINQRDAHINVYLRRWLSSL